MSENLAIIGDIHGNILALNGMLRLVRRLRNRIIFVGDYINRGPDSKAVIDQLIMWSQIAPDSVFLRGNHETALIEFLKGGTLAPLLEIGGVPTVRSYINQIPDADVSSQFRRTFPSAHYTFMRDLASSYEDQDADFGISVSHYPPRHLRSTTSEKSQRYHVYGHEVQNSKKPKITERYAAIDTGCGTLSDGPLTCIFWPSLEWIQVDSLGHYQS